jgi:alcohol dehydrogenase YqhD (iron-dependent ADH family)
MKAIVSLSIDVYNDPTNYDKYAQLMWAGTMAHNYILCVGRETDWASHQIEHELSGMFDVAHGAGLAVVIPAWMKYTMKQNPGRLAQLGVNVFGIQADYMDIERTALKTIEAVKAWFKSLSMPLTLNELGIPESAIEQLAKDTTRNDNITQGTYVKLTSKDVEEILKLAL